MNTPWDRPQLTDGNSRSDRLIDPAKTSCFPLAHPFLCYIGETQTETS